MNATTIISFSTFLYFIAGHQRFTMFSASELPSVSIPFNLVGIVGSMFWFGMLLFYGYSTGFWSGVWMFVGCSLLAGMTLPVLVGLPLTAVFRQFAPFAELVLGFIAMPVAGWFMWNSVVG